MAMNWTRQTMALYLAKVFARAFVDPQCRHMLIHPTTGTKIPTWSEGGGVQRQGEAWAVCGRCESLSVIARSEKDDSFCCGRSGRSVSL